MTCRGEVLFCEAACPEALEVFLFLGAELRGDEINDAS